MLGKNKKDKRHMQLDFSDSEIKYANLAVLSHSKAEFIIDFARILPGMDEPEVQDRIVMTPIHAKLLMHALSGNIEKFEEKFGEIEIPKGAGQNMGFKV